MLRRVLPACVKNLEFGASTSHEQVPDEPQTGPRRNLRKRICNKDLSRRMPDYDWLDGSLVSDPAGSPWEMSRSSRYSIEQIPPLRIQGTRFRKGHTSLRIQNHNLKGGRLADPSLRNSGCVAEPTLRNSGMKHPPTT